MKKNLNIIQIKGIRGLMIAAGVVSCLVAGFVAFPGWVWMHLWNYTASYINGIPSIGLLQGILLWGIIIVSYFVFRKDRVIICVKTPQGLSEEELKNVFADIKKHSQEDPILQAMLKAREAELKIKTIEVPENKESEHKAKSDSSKV